MVEWKETNLGEICSDISYGYTASAKQDAIGPKFLRITDIVPDRINWQTVPFCETDAPTIEKYKLKNGDIVIARTGATTGYNKIIKNISHDAVYASYLIRYQIDETKAYPYYIGHILQSSNWYDYVDAIAGGSAQPGANAKQLASFEILLPPLPEQKAIASVLSSLDDKIDLVHRQNKTLEAMAETLFRQWFVESDYSCKVSDLIEVQNGYAFKSKDFKDVGINGVIKIKNISGDVVDIYNCDFIEDLVANQTDSRFIIETGDVLFAMTGAEIGKMGIVLQTERKLWLNQRVGLFKEKYNGSRFLAYLQLKSDYGQDYIDNTATGSAQPNISGSGIENCEFPKITENQIKKYSEKLLCLYEKVIFNLGQIRTLEKLRDTLLPKLMSGEVRVKT